MIELVSQSRCISCSICVDVCPTDVFDISPGEAPTIARQADCQTCFLCEAYCPVDALFVAAEAHHHVEVKEEDLIQQGLLGAYRRNLGWGKGSSPSHRMSRLQELRADLDAHPYPTAAPNPSH